MTSSIAALLCTLFSLLSTALSIGFAAPYFVNNGGYDDNGNKHAVSYNYDRTADVTKECASILQSSDRELKPDDGRLYTIKEELSFSNGDWFQSSNLAPLMPFDDRDLSGIYTNPINLISFWVNDVDRKHRLKNSIFVSGFSQLSISLGNRLADKPYEQTPKFDIWPSQSQLSISFQGVYTESGQNRVMCLLGNALLPSRGTHASNPWEWMKENGYNNRPLLTQDDRILLLLHYPKVSTLKNRAINGSMKSLHPKTSLKYFDEVVLSSSVGPTSNYEFTSDDLVSKACESYPNSNSIDVYKGVDFCVILERFTKGLTVLPNWKCNGTDEYCSKLGPFDSNSKEINATNGSFANVQLVIENVRCENVTSSKEGFTRVSSVFRVLPPSEVGFSESQRTGLNRMTLSAEGVWNSSNGQLCMVGCSPYDKDNACNTRICMYVPISFSITQRSIITGTFSSIDQTVNSYFPLSFEKLVRPAEILDQYTASNPYYNYSKIDFATAILEKYEPSNIGAAVKKSFLKFPLLQETGNNLLYSVSLLSEDLTLHITAVPDPLPSSLYTNIQLGLELISIGPFFGRLWAPQYSQLPKEEDNNSFYNGKEKQQLLLNVSAQLDLMGDYHYTKNFSSLSLEGIYDPFFGKMYLIGCRDVRASWRILYESMDLENGLDCLIEVVISYPPTTSRWLVDPTAKISITSQRNEDDPLYFIPLKLQTVPVMYRDQREDILSRRGVEGILRIATLSLAIACISSQLFYIRDSIESVPFVSIVMLGVQAIGYSLPLITGAEALFSKGAKTGFSEGKSNDYSVDYSVIDYTVKFLVLIAFSLTLRLCQKVWKSRVRMLTRSPLEPHRVPNDKKVLFITLFTHILGYVIVLFVHYMNTSYKPIQRESFVDSSGYSRSISEWQNELVEYIGLVQDFFLLPQVIGNLLWMINVKPLRKMYYIGITCVRLFPHAYDFVKQPVVNPYFYEEYEFVNPRMDFYSRFGDIAIPIIAVLLVVVIYVQQRWNYEKLSEKLVLGQKKLLPLGSKVYERLPSLSFEAELASNSTFERERD